MAKEYSNLRPSILTVEARDKVVSYGQGFAITFMVATYRLYQDFKVAVIAPPFATHSFGMNQRLIYLDIIGGAQKLSMFGYKVSVVAPVTKNIAPPGHYMLFVVHNGIPGECVWIQINN
ncbi:hypothetical protein HYC85_023302 [Camellia sinensis]|uniref:Galactose oxidase-like Early set domain-containing protein n=1 Tax=Camellia sinensis TaxID=4442 RepID=A0A7J7GE59_CAMSI|nr:hypothetical protein HYC85_023302 [Camellia sinensis]